MPQRQPIRVDVERDGLQFELEQYRALRAEIIQSMGDGNSVMGFGITAIGLIVNAAVGAYDTTFGFLLLTVVLPLLSALIVSMWLAAQERTARASHFLSGVEDRVRAVLGGPNAHETWELWLRDVEPDREARHFWSTEQAAFGIFGLIAICSLGLGLSGGGGSTGLVVRLLVGVPSMLACSVLALSIRRRYRKWQRLLSTRFESDAYGLRRR